MTATTVFFDGRRTAVPGVETKIDASGLEQLGLGATGVVALVGTAIGGRPTNASTTVDQLIRLNTPADNRNLFRYRGDASALGDLREAAAMAFAPSTDPAIPAGAQQIVCIKVNQAEKGSTTLSFGSTATLLVQSDDWGAFTNQINLSVTTAAATGATITVNFESDTEAATSVGVVDAAQTGNETSMFTLDYEPDATAGFTSWGTMTADVLPTGSVRAYGSVSSTGLDPSATTVAGGERLQVTAANPADAGKTVTVYGLDGSNDTIREALVVDGGLGEKTFTAYHGYVLDDGTTAAAGNLTVENASTTPMTVASTATEGVLISNTLYAAGKVLVEQTGGLALGGAYVGFWGRDSSGTVISESVLTLASSATPNAASTAATFANIDVIVMGDALITGARTLTFTAVAAATDPNVETTLQKVADYYNGRQVDDPASTTQEFGFNCNLLTGQIATDPATLDWTGSAADIHDNATHAGFSAVLQAIISWMSTSSGLISGTRTAFTPASQTITVTGGNAGTWVLTFNGTTAISTDGAGTVIGTRDALVSAINNDSVVSLYAVAANGSSDGELVITAATAKTSPLTTALTTNPGGAWSITASTTQSGAGKAPSSMTSPTFLSGGTEYGTDGGIPKTAPTDNDWTNAIAQLRNIDVNTVVPLSGDPSIHSVVQNHCAEMCGAGKSERDGLVGLVAVDSDNEPVIPITLATKSSLKSQALSLNSRHMRATCQTITRFDTNGTQREFMPWYQAALAGGMQAGSPVGTSLTRKTANVIAVNQDNSWKPGPLDDASDMILSGLWFMEPSRVGRRVVRNITTYLQSTNLAFVEASVNEAANFAVFNFRNALETVVGKPGFVGTLVAGKAAASSILNQLLAEGTIVQWRALQLTLNGDTLDVSVEIAPVIPINFVKATVHLVTVTQTA